MIKCLKCGEPKPRDEFTKSNLCKMMHECKICQRARLGAEAVIHAKDKAHQMSERLKMQAGVRGFISLQAYS